MEVLQFMQNAELYLCIIIVLFQKILRFSFFACTLCPQTFATLVGVSLRPRSVHWNVSGYRSKKLLRFNPSVVSLMSANVLRSNFSLSPAALQQLVMVLFSRWSPSCSRQNSRPAVRERPQGRHYEGGSCLQQRSPGNRRSCVSRGTHAALPSKACFKYIF